MAGTDYFVRIYSNGIKVALINMSAEDDADEDIDLHDFYEEGLSENEDEYEDSEPDYYCEWSDYGSEAEDEE